MFVCVCVCVESGWCDGFGNFLMGYFSGVHPVSMSLGFGVLVKGMSRAS